MSSAMMKRMFGLLDFGILFSCERFTKCGDGCRSRLAWKQERDQQAELFAGRTLRVLDVVVVLQAEADGAAVEDGRAGDAEAERHGPLVAARRIPVGADDRREGQRPAVAEVVVDERLEREEIRFGITACVAERPQLRDQRS